MQDDPPRDDVDRALDAWTALPPPPDFADRVLAARDHYPQEARFYDDLRTQANRVYHVQAGHGLTGPWVSLYRL